MDILDYLEADQDALKDLVAEFKTAETDSPHEAEAFTALVSAMRLQFKSQTVLFNRLAAEQTGFAQLIHPLLERMQGASEVERIIECCTNRATWRASVDILCEMLETEIESERQTLLPAIFDQIDFAGRRKLGQNYRKLRGFNGRFRSFAEASSAIQASDNLNWENVWTSVINQAG